MLFYVFFFQQTMPIAQQPSYHLEIHILQDVPTSFHSQKSQMQGKVMVHVGQKNTQQRGLKKENILIFTFLLNMLLS